MDKYAAFVDKFIRKNDRELHGFLGLASEAGEVLDVYKKDKIYKKETSKEEYLDELGDTLFYLQAICNELDYTLDDVKEYNIVKILERYSETNVED